jgi:hypothetical protein
MHYGGKQFENQVMWNKKFMYRGRGKVGYHLKNGGGVNFGPKIWTNAWVEKNKK